MGRMDNELQTLVDQVANSLHSLPQDGVERQITIRVGGNNSGTINVGPTVNITPPQPRPRTYEDFDNRELLSIRRDLVSKNTRAKLRCYLNFPAFLSLMLFLVASVFALLNAYLLFTGGKSFLVLTGETFVVYTAWVVLLALSARSLNKIRKIESIIIYENQNTIDAIDVILRRRS
ncbi:hypothetical protein ACE2MM_000809 [Salmonella enterica]